MYFYAARQPILDKEKNLFAYELLFRDSLKNVFPDVNEDEATSKMIDASRFNIGLHEFTAGKPAFINFTIDSLNNHYPEILTPDELVVEILETVQPGKRLLTHCKDLFKKGYTIALDDYIHQPAWKHFYPYVHIIKLDWRTTSLDEMKTIKQAIVAHPHIKLLAEKVETYEEYEQALELGCELFQGYFFSKPEMVKTKSSSPSQVVMAELLYETSKPDINLNNITAMFERDITLSYKLLRYTNSAIFMRAKEISTIKQALVTLGANELKRFMTLMFAANANPEKPSELIKLSMARAKFCEEIAKSLKVKMDSSSAFLIGLLSLIDAILDEKLEIILTSLPLSEEIKAPLLTQKGPIAEILKLVSFIERANWSETDILICELSLNKSNVIAAYNKALTSADEQFTLTT